LPKVVVDSREAVDAPTVVEKLRDSGVDVEVKLLEVGDYLIPRGGYLIERKTPQDLVASIRLGRLWRQVEELKSVENAKPIVVVEGSLKMIERFTKFKPVQVVGIINSIIFDWGIPVITLPGRRWMASYLEQLAKSAEIEDRKHTQIRFEKKFESISEAQEYLIAGLPGINTSRARALLEYFGTPKRIFNASQWELMQVPGIGEKTASKIIEVLTTKYKVERSPKD